MKSIKKCISYFIVVNFGKIQGQFVISILKMTMVSDLMSMHVQTVIVDNASLCSSIVVVQQQYIMQQHRYYILLKSLFLFILWKERRGATVQAAVRERVGGESDWGRICLGVVGSSLAVVECGIFLNFYFFIENFLLYLIILYILNCRSYLFIS